MYYLIIILLMLVFPVASIGAEHIWLHSPATLLALTGKWFVFWGVGVRLGLAGLRQIFQPAYTAETIFGLTDKGSQHIVQELGFGNVAMSVLGLLSLAFPAWAAPAAITGGLFYGLAGIKHVTTSSRTPQQQVAMISDLFIFLVLAGFSGATLWLV